FDLITSRFSSNVPLYEKIGNVNVYRVGNFLSRFSFLLPKNFLPIAVFFKAHRLIAQHGPYDLIHAYQASQAAGGGWLLKWAYPRIPFLVTVQEGKILTSQSVLTRFFRYFIFKKADHATVISNYLAKYVASQNKNLPVTVIPNGVDLENIRKHESGSMNQELKEKLGISFQDKVIITVSRLVEKNGIADLIRAMVFIKGNYSEPTKLLIVGDAEPHLSIESDLKSLTKELGLVSNIVFVGAVEHDDVLNYLSIADVFVRPSRSEGLGTAFLEAMAMEVPIIGTRVGGIVDFLQESQTGLYCTVGDSQDIGRKIIQILSNRELHDKLANQGRELVRREYDWDIIVQKFRDIYETITKN
ncbi:MAG: glycosyltransferase family 4 protein, partial [bacterium]|nr:glycosyltransferase family 4 protein [bacterium]